MGHARKRPKLEEGEVSSSDDDCIIVDARVKKGRESPKVIQDHRHHLSTSKPNTTSYPFCSECCRYFQSDAEKERHYSKWHYGNICHACDEGFPTESELLQVSSFSWAGSLSDLTHLFSTKLATLTPRFAASAARNDSNVIQQ
jgi:hypothetical protein